MPSEKTPQQRSKPRIKTYTNTGSEKVKDPRDELLKKFSKNFRRVMENRENLLADKPIHPPKSVKFDPDIVETSIGGTQSLGRINQLSDTSISSYSSTSTTTGNSSTLSSDNSSSDSCTFNGSLSQSYIDTSSINGHNVSSSTKRKSVDQNAQRRSSTKGFITPSKLPRRLTGDGPLPSTPECFNPVSFETPKPKSVARRSASLEPRDDQDNSSVTVAVRVRPFSTRELATGEAKCVVSMVDNETIVTEKSGNSHHFVYDYSFWSFDKHGGSFANQEYVYNTLAQPMLGKAFEGYNVCLFAYGQTGSGKSYSIMGQGKDTGVIPRFCEDLFNRVEAETKDRVNVQISFFEIYNEKIHDLLQHDNKDKLGKKINLKVREHPLLGPFVEGLSSHSVESFEDVETWLNLGNKHRATAATGMNDKSSRSHSVFTMVLTQTKVDTIEHEKHEHSITSKINLVDLAGSERQSQAKTSGDRLREGASINKSLLTLGKVISLLSESSISGKRKLFIPYRDSVLTWLLKESLGGNSKTAMLATIGPSNFHVEETLSTLRYAKQARSIINQAKVNEDPKAKLIRELRSEIEKLKSQSGMMGADPEIIVTSLAEISSLREQLLEKEREMQEMTKSWQERLKKSEERKVQEAKSLEKSGISFRVDNKRPSLVNLNEDPQLSEMLLYILKDGQTKIGQNKEGSTHDVKLCGPLIAVNHCILNYVNDIVSITPIKDALTYVNGNLITEPTILHHGDRVILGGDHYFRFNHPIEASKPGRKSIGKGLKDFEFARKELLDVQNANGLQKNSYDGD